MRKDELTLTLIRFLGISAICMIQTLQTVRSTEVNEPGIYVVFRSGESEWVCQLEYKLAPRTVANFLSMAEGTRPWFNYEKMAPANGNLYEGTAIHRIISKFMIQAGSPNGAGDGNPGFAFRDEFHETLRHDSAGTLSMANSGPNTNGSQFFITVAPTPWLDNKHSVFGKVIEGLDKVIAISELPSDIIDRPITPLFLDSVEIIRNGSEAEAFSHLTLEDPLPQLIGRQSLKISESNSIMSLDWTKEENRRYTLLNSSNLNDWSLIYAGTDSNINLIFSLGDGQIALMQDIYPTGSFILLTSETD